METTTTTTAIINNIDNDDDFNKRVESYMKLSQRTLAELLALRDEQDNKQPVNVPSCPLQPAPVYPYQPYVGKWCPVSMGSCNNPFGDCINCPYHGHVTWETNPNWTVNTTNTADAPFNPGTTTCNNNISEKVTKPRKKK